MVKADSDKYKNMLKEVRKLCEKLNDIIDDDIVIRILTKCQESVIVIGESLEKIERANEKEVLKKLQTVNKLEQLCELLYQYSQKMERNIRKEIIRIIDNIICDIDTIPRTYRVTFLPYKAAMWDSLESIWREFAASDECETSVVPIPYFEANRKTNQWDTCYEGNKYPDYVPVVNFQDYLLGQKRPDLVFVHNPFDQFNNVTTVHPAYYSAELKKSCEKLVYVPYYVNPGFISDDYNELPLLYR